MSSTTIAGLDRNGALQSWLALKFQIPNFLLQSVTSVLWGMTYFPQFGLFPKEKPPLLLYHCINDTFCNEFKSLVSQIHTFTAKARTPHITSTVKNLLFIQFLRRKILSDPLFNLWIRLPGGCFHEQWCDLILHFKCQSIYFLILIIFASFYIIIYLYHTTDIVTNYIVRSLNTVLR